MRVGKSDGLLRRSENRQQEEGSGTIFRFGVKNQLEPSLELLMKYLGSIENIEKALKLSSWLLTSNFSLNVQPNIDLLISEGVSLDAIQLMITNQPRAAPQKTDTMAKTIEAFLELGTEPSSLLFIHAVCVRVAMSEATWNRKFDVFRSLGWANEEIVSAFVLCPFFLACSEEKIRAVTNFIVNTMKLSQAIIIAYPKFLLYSIESQYKPRFFVFSMLKSKNLLKDNLKSIQVIRISEEKFFRPSAGSHEDLYQHAPRKQFKEEYCSYNCNDPTGGPDLSRCKPSLF
ncbi:hypothetical protein QQ045_004478 [Rhodiola kirilowii]